MVRLLVSHVVVGGASLALSASAVLNRPETSKSFAKRDGAPVDEAIWDKYDAQRIRMLEKHAKILKNHAHNTLYSTVDPLASVKNAASALEAAHDYSKLSARGPRPRSDPVGIAAGPMRRAVGSATMNMYNYYTGVDITYVGNVTVGTPGQDFLILPDTGSADLWVIDSGTQTDHTTFNPSRSSSYVSNSAPFAEEYGSGEVSGISANDTVTIAGLSIPNQGLGVVNRTDSAIEQSAFDGLMGLAFSTISELGAYTFFENAILNGDLTDPVFSVYLSRGYDYLGGTQTGYLTNGAQLGFGYVVTPPVAVTDAEFTFSNVVVQGYWEVACDGLTIGGTTQAGTSFYAAIDTGTSLIYLPTAVATAFYEQLGGISLGGGQWAVPSANITSLPTLGLSFGGKSFQMNFDDFALQYTDSSRDYILGAIIGSDQQDPVGNLVAIVGDAFLKNVLSVYTYSRNSQPAVGFASLSTSSANATVVTATSSVPGLVTSRGGSTVSATGSVALTSATGASSVRVPTASATAATSGAKTIGWDRISAILLSLVCVLVGIVTIC